MKYPPLGHVGLEKPRCALLLSIFVHLFVHYTKFVTNKDITPSNDLYTFRFPK